MNKSLFLIITCLGIVLDLQGQRGLELGFWLGTSQYFGDLQTELTIADPGLAGGINARYNFDERISVKASLNHARVGGDDADSPNTFERQRNLSFKSGIWDASLHGEFNFLPYIHGSSDEWFTPYLLAGVSIFAYSPKAELEGVSFNLRDFGTEGQAIGEEYSRFSRSFNFGFGFKWDINFDYSFNIELSVHNTQTDYLDDVSSVYPNLNDLADVRGNTAVNLSNRALTLGLAETGRQRGNSSNKDSYVMLGVSFMKYFGTLDCPDVSNQRKKIRKRANTLDW